MEKLNLTWVDINLMVGALAHKLMSENRHHISGMIALGNDSLIPATLLARNLDKECRIVPIRMNVPEDFKVLENILPFNKGNYLVIDFFVNSGEGFSAIGDHLERLRTKDTHFIYCAMLVTKEFIGSLPGSLRLMPPFVYGGTCEGVMKIYSPWGEVI